MPTRKPRINMVLASEDYAELRALAERAGTSLSDLTRSLVLEMLEILEDRELAAMASERRESLSGGKTLAHEAVWGSRAHRLLTRRSHELRRHLSSRRRKARSSRDTARLASPHPARD
ncbi:MAG: hypothetical protein HY716_02295 [Planctomycetes bacterium]|nr:hypothetical protein [Planctomycetota bacterium]